MAAPDFKSLIRNLESTKSMLAGRSAVSNGKLRGPGVKASQNAAIRTEVAPTGEKARHNRLYRDSLLGKLEGDLSEEDIEAITTKYIENIANRLMEGF